MKDNRQTDNTIVTKLLAAAIVVSVMFLGWLVYERLVAPYLIANQSLSERQCLSDDKYCFSYPDTWQADISSTKDESKLVFSNQDDSRMFEVRKGSNLRADECDPREKRQLFIIDSVALGGQAADGSQPQVYAVKAVMETPADGFMVPAMYLSSNKEHSKPVTLDACGLDGGNIITVKDDQTLFTGIDSYDAHPGSTAPVYRSVEKAVNWLDSAEARLSFRILSSLSYQ